MAKTYIKELQETIEQLNDGVDVLGVEKALLQNSVEDFQEPNRLLGEQSGYLLDMLGEVLTFEKKQPSERITASKNRLINLLHINTRLNNLMSYNHSKTLLNQQLFGELQKVRLENHKLRLEIEKLSKSNEF